MKKIIALGGSNSKTSINKRLATYAAHRLQGVEITVVDLNELDLPLYGVDLERETGIPDEAKRLNEQIEATDGLVVSLAEHNGVYSVAFKNVFDWLSRIETKVWKDKPMLLMATSPGSRGGASVLQIASDLFPYAGANIVSRFSLPSFFDNFSESGIKDKTLSRQLDEEVKKLQTAIE